MARVTKNQLVDENAALREQLDKLLAQRDFFEENAALLAQLDKLREQRDIFEAQISELHVRCSDLALELAELRSQFIDAQPRAQRDSAGSRKTLRDIEHVVAEYTKRDGSRWVKVRTGWNTYAHRRVA